MQAYVLFSLFAVTLAGYGVDQGWLPGQLRLLPEAISGTAFLMVVMLGVRSQFRFVRPEYWFAIAAIALVMLFGVIANGVDSGPVISGVRYYLRALPLFLLPAVYGFTDRDVRNQLLVLLCAVVVQLPLTISQKNTEMFFGNTSGDFVMGTLAGSGLLSIFLLCGACVLTGFYLRGKIPIWAWLFLLGVTLAPTAINETKATFLLLPVGLLVTYWAAADRSQRVKSVLIATSVVGLSAALIIPVYDYWADQRPAAEGGGVSVLEFFTNEDTLDQYVNFDPDKEEVLLGRGAAYRVALADSASDPVRGVLGLGIGNASTSSLGRGFSGEFALEYLAVRQTSAILFILEIGLSGLLLSWLVQLMVFVDARAVRERDTDFWAGLSAGWCGVIAVIFVSAFYAELLQSPGISYPFWYISGLIAARRLRLDTAATSRRPARPAVA